MLIREVSHKSLDAGHHIVLRSHVSGVNASSPNLIAREMISCRWRLGQRYRRRILRRVDGIFPARTINPSSDIIIS